METVTIRKAKTDLSRLIARVWQGEEIVITRGKKPVVRLVALRDEHGNRKPGAEREDFLCPRRVCAADRSRTEGFGVRVVARCCSP